MSVSCKCCVLSGRGLCAVLITSPTVCGVSECDREGSIMSWPRLTVGCCATDGS